MSDLDVYKIFTSKPLTTHHVNRLFRTHSEFVFVDWKAYPNYDEIRQDAQVGRCEFLTAKSYGHFEREKNCHYISEPL